MIDSLVVFLIFYIPVVVISGRLIIRDARKVDWSAVRKDIKGWHIHNWVKVSTQPNGDVMLECSRTTCTRKTGNGGMVLAKNVSPDLLVWLERNRVAADLNTRKTSD